MPASTGVVSVLVGERLPSDGAYDRSFSEIPHDSQAASRARDCGGGRHDLQSGKGDGRRTWGKPPSWVATLVGDPVDGRRGHRGLVETGGDPDLVSTAFLRLVD